MLKIGDGDISVSGTQIEIMAELSLLMFSLMDEGVLDEQDIFYALKTAIEIKEKKRKSDEFREKFMNNLFRE